MSQIVGSAKHEIYQKMLRLSCVTQQYAWGKLGKDSMVACLKKLASGVDIAEADPYAELWMGTHCSGPSTVTLPAEDRESYGGQSEVLLSAWLANNPAAVGRVPPAYAPNDLPFLFKVLSVRTALSIQAHPDKTLAAELHAAHPTVYKDPNHKPEMAIALTRFEALYGFRLLSEVQANVLETYPEFQALLGDETVSLLRSTGDQSSAADQENAIRTVLDRYMHCDAEVAQNSLRAMIARVTAKQNSEGAAAGSLDALILRLHSQYPGDTGVFAPLLLNYLQLEPMQSFFMGAGVPHAYLSGDCVECMAPSDNVVRVGLTPKFKDVETLCKMLVYKCEKPTAFIEPLKRDDFTSIYRPPASVCEEFEVEVTTLPAVEAARSCDVASCECGSVVLVLQGEGQMELVQGGTGADANPFVQAVKSGDVYFLPANTAYRLQHSCSAAPQQDLVLCRAHANCQDA